MESYKSFGGRIGLVCLCLGIFLLLQNVDAELNKTDPTDNVNLAPYDAWISAYYCLNRSVPANCNKTGQLTDQGLMYVAPNDVQEYCSPESGCAKHALDVLKCVYLCKRDFWFHNNATVPYINQTIIDGCAKNSSAISTMDYKSSGKKLNQKIYIPLIASLSTLAYIAMSNIM